MGGSLSEPPRQGTEAWRRQRLGRITGSEMHRVMGGPRAWASYARQLREEAELLARIEAGEEVELGQDFDVAATAWGRRWESVALAEYAFQENVDVKPAGFTIHGDYPFIGCSVDGEVYRDAAIIEGVVEVKCPYSESVHLRILACGVVPDEHVAQVQAEIWVVGVEWGAFVSFDPRRDLDRRYFCRLPDRDDEYIARMEGRCLEFWEFVQSGLDEPGRIKSDLTSGAIPRLF